MCGRYVSPYVAEAERYFLVHVMRWKFERSFNVAPTQQVPVVRIADGEREGVTLRWGLVPFFAKGIPPKYSTINAPIEKLSDGPCWRGPWKRANAAFCQRQASMNGMSRRTAARRPARARRVLRSLRPPCHIGMSGNLWIVIRGHRRQCQFDVGGEMVGILRRLK